MNNNYSHKVKLKNYNNIGKIEKPHRKTIENYEIDK